MASPSTHLPLSSRQARTLALTSLVCLLVAAGAALAVDDPIRRGAAALTGVTLVLWLSEALPPFATTLLLVGAVPLVLGGHGDTWSLRSVMGWAADPVLALFLGGFALSAAASRYGIDAQVAHLVVRGARGSRRRLVALVALGTAGLSMWMSNIAAAAMMIVAMRPLFIGLHKEAPFRRAALLAVAMGANLGGMATPIGTGPNGIAIAAAQPWREISFFEWMLLGLPLTLGMLALAIGLIITLHKVGGPFESHAPEPAHAPPGTRGVLVIFSLTVAAWLLEPLHGVPAAVVALLSTGALFGGGLLSREDLQKIDWSSLLLIAGGLTLGRLLESSHLITAWVQGVSSGGIPTSIQLLGFALTCALLSALMSNTATVVLLMPLALSLSPSASTAIILAMASSFGVPFTISTPPNVMAYGEGGLRARDLLIPGLVVMTVGCLLVSVTGPLVLGWLHSW